MTVKEVYEKLGANYDEVFSRLRSDDRILRFLLKIPDDDSYDLLINSMAAKDIREAFRAAHTLKGLCLNFSLTRLLGSASALTEALRDKTEYSADMEPLLNQVKTDYAQTLEAIATLKEEQ